MDEKELAEHFAQYQLTFKQARACPRPDKLRYPQQYAAEQAAEARSVVYGHVLRAYHCVCDWWHLTSKPDKNATEGESN